jgi:hypothetical protein
VRGWLGVEGISYFGAKPFIDWIHTAHPYWNNNATPPAYQGAGGWLYAIPNNSNDGLIIHTTPENAEPYTCGLPSRPFTIKAVWNEPLLTVSFDTGAGLSHQNNSATPPAGWSNACSIQVDSETVTVTLRVKNLSGSTLASTKKQIAVYLSANEARFTAGETFDQNWKLSLRRGSQGAYGVRVMGWNRPNTMGYASPGDGSLGGSIAFTDFAAETDRCWEFVPWSVIGKLGRDLDCNLWVNVHSQCTDACVTSAATDVFAYLPSTRVVKVESGNEAWNRGGVFSLDGNWLRDTKSVGLSVVDGDGNASTNDNDKIACAMAECAARSWAAFENIGGTNRVVRVLGGQAASFNTTANAALEYTVANNPALARYGAVKIKAIVQQGAIAPYFVATSGGVQFDLKTMCKNKIYNNGDAYLTTAFEDSIDNVQVGWVNSWKTSLAAKAPQATLTAYEAGGEALFALETAATMYSFTINTGDNTMLSASSIASDFDDGDRVRRSFFATEPASVTAGTVAGKATWYVKKNGTTKLEFYSDAALTSRVTLDGDTAVTWTFDNITRAEALSSYIKGNLDGAPGATLYAYYKAKVFDNKLEEFMQFTNTMSLVAW